MQFDLVARHSLRILAFATVLCVVLGCSNGASTATQLSTLSCSATGTSATGTSVVSGTISVSAISVSIYSGTGPFLITLPGASAVSSSVATYTYPGTISVATDTSGNVSSYVSVSDQSNGGSTSCLLSVTGYTGGTTITGTGTGVGTYPYYYGSGSVTCSLQYNATYYYVGQQIPFSISTSTGEVAYVTALSTGEAYAYPPTYPFAAPFYIRYSTVGPKQISLQAVTASGVPCNGGAGITDSIFINY